MHGHEVVIEKGAGRGLSIADSVRAGASIVPDADVLFETSDMVLKVKEPIEEESTGSAMVCCCSRTCTSQPAAR